MILSKSNWSQILTFTTMARNSECLLCRQKINTKRSHSIHSTPTAKKKTNTMIKQVTYRNLAVCRSQRLWPLQRPAYSQRITASNKTKNDHEKLKCEKCSISCSTPSNLKRHIFIAHSNEPKQCQCDVCEKWYQEMKTKNI